MTKGVIKDPNKIDGRKNNGCKPGENRSKKAGTQNRGTSKRIAIANELLAKADITPLQVMLEAMAVTYYGESGDERNAVAAFPLAKEIAPYLHPRLQSVEAKIDTEVHFVVSGAPLSDEEWSKKHGVIIDATDEGNLVAPAGAATGFDRVSAP